MKLYWREHTCAIGIHVLLEEIGVPYELEKLESGDTGKPPFLAINPKGKVPTLLRDDGSVLTEFSAIATWLARTNPEKKFLSSDPEAEARAIEVMAYIEGTIHGQGFGRIFAPQLFEPQDAIHGKLGLGQQAVVAQGREMASVGFSILDTQMGQQPYVTGDKISIADFALFYAERWAAPNDIKLPINIARHLKTMKARPAVHKVMKLWGEA
jgi:glutathione S-transferase